MRKTSILLLALFLIALAGCGGPRLAPVTGNVTYQNKPLKEGSITFIPAKGRSATGKIVNGEIVDVTTIKKGDGATVGPVKVAIQATENTGDMYKEKALLPAQFGNADTSKLTADIQSGDNKLTFDLK